jgi:hypothetical protein
MCTKVDYGSVGGCEGWTAQRTPSRLQGEEPMGMRADEPHLHRLLYYYDQSFTILEKNYSEMADKFSFDLRRIKKNSFFSDVTVT